MTTDEIILELSRDLKLAKSALEQWAGQKVKLEAEVLKLETAVAALKGEALPVGHYYGTTHPGTLPLSAEKKKPHQGPTVAEMLKESALVLPTNARFTKHSLTEMTAGRHPEHSDKVKRGVHYGFKVLMRNGIFIEVPGGYGLCPLARKEETTG
jgi:hypothetical protein